MASSTTTMTNFSTLVKIVPVSLIIMIVIDLWFVYHNSKLHSWFAYLVCFPLLTFFFELSLLIRYSMWMFDQKNPSKSTRVTSSIRHLVIGQLVVAFTFWITISIAVHQLEPDRKSMVDKDHKYCKVYMASPEYLATRGQRKSIDTDTCRKYQLMTFLMYEGAWFFATLLLIFCFCAPIAFGIS